ncbi:cisplatin damage response ATP-dependent DNA ligase [Fodinicurvata sp. EGI_FJ10296]|uniref:cisplatin damage response ATP-dependent DNA ligase n=1 Tax=Fodinicurvata sp. EGI_FJ10296 TaxID=3231908 RepID=UPI0034568149
MKRFAALMEKLVFTPSRNGKLRHMAAYFRSTPDPDRGYALAALAGTLDFTGVKAGAIRSLATARIHPQLFAWSCDYVGDLAETVSLVWPDGPSDDAAGPETGPHDLSLSEVVETLRATSRRAAPSVVERWLDVLAPTQRFALLKLITGGLRVGVSARLAKTALTEAWHDADLAAIEEVWHGMEPPYIDLFAWLDGTADRPSIDDRAVFRPMMLANPLEEEDILRLDPADYRAEWKFDGIRVQLAARGGQRRLFSRTGDEIGAAFPDIVEAMTFDAVLDGELLVMTDGAVQSFNALQQRLNRKTVDAGLLQKHPAWVRVYDILMDEGADLRALPFDQRRARLQGWIERTAPARMDISPLIAFAGWDDLRVLRDSARDTGDEGLMLKHRESAYVAGRPKGPWFKWKRGALTLDTVLMYAQRGHGKRSSYYSDFTFGAWRPDPETGQDALVPVGKAYFGFTDAELTALDKWIRANTVRRYGPVREVPPGLVLEVAFDSIHPSTRHKSGLAMRFPRIHRIRWDKPAAEADRLETLRALVRD